MSARKVADRLELLEWLPQNAVVAEVGVAYGEFAEEILKRCQPKRLHLIDLWEYQHPAIFTDSVNPAFSSQERHTLHLDAVYKRFTREIASGQVVIHRGYSDQELLTFPDEYFDWVYIDANHAYETVKADLLAANRKVKRGGFICGHDYVKDPREALFPYGVIEAVDEFCREEKYKMVVVTEEAGATDPYPSYALTQLETSL